MPQRIRMNSETLQETFPEVYGEFFSKCEAVISAPGNFYWCGEHANVYGELCIKQNIPIRVYIGIKKTDSMQIEFNDLYLFSHRERHFILDKHATVVGTLRKKKIIDLLMNQWTKIKGPQDNFSGFQINMLSELSLGCGQSSSGAFSAAISLAFYLYFNKVTPSEVSNWYKVKLDKLINNKSFKFDEIFRLAWKIESVFHGGMASGAAHFSCFANSTFPIVYFTEFRIGDSQYHPGSRFPQCSSGKYDVYDKINYYGFKLEDFFNLSNVNSWPIDFCLIYSGEKSSTEAVNLSTVDTRDTLEEVIKNLSRTQLKNLVSDNFSSNFKIIKNRESKLKLWYKYIECLGVISWECLYGLQKMFATGFSDYAMTVLFRSINSYQKGLEILGISSPVTDRITNLILHYSNLKETKMAVKLTGPGKGGDILVAMPLYSFQYEMHKFINYLREKSSKDVRADYISWVDGYEENGMKIEQFLEHKIYSKYVSPKSLYLKSWDKLGTSSSYIYSPEKFFEEKNKIDILMDEADQKIYIRGRALTSKQIHSTKVTIEIIKILLNNLGKEVPAASLPPSYYIDRNEMQSKIVSPLKEITEKKLGKELPLVITGGLRKNFSLKLEPSNLKIYLKEKII